MKRQITALNQAETPWGYLMLFTQLLVLPTAVSICIDYFHISISASLENLICFALNFLCVTVIFHRFWCRSVKALGANRYSILSAVALYLPAYYLFTYLINFLVYSIAPGHFNANDANIAVMTNESRLMMAIGVVLFVPAAEEFLFRGVIFGSLYAQQPILSYAVSIVAFAAVHVLGYIGFIPPAQLLLSFLQYIPAGYCLARSYARSGSIFAPILIHTFINFIGIMSIS